MIFLFSLFISAGSNMYICVSNKPPRNKINKLILLLLKNLGYCFLKIKYNPKIKNIIEPTKYHIPKNNLNIYSNIDGIKPSLKKLAPLLKIARSEEHTSELQSRFDLVCRLLLEKKK